MTQPLPRLHSLNRFYLFDIVLLRVMESRPLADFIRPIKMSQELLVSNERPPAGADRAEEDLGYISDYNWKSEEIRSLI